MFSRITRSKSKKIERGESSRRNHAQPPTPPPREVDTDSDPDDSKSEYDPAACPLERELGFSIPNRRMLQNIQVLRHKRFEHTRLVDLNALEELGVVDDFLALTRRIGIHSGFWKFQTEAYYKATLEFLASLQLKEDEEEVPYIKFRLSSHTYRYSISRLREIFHFSREPDVQEINFREGWDKPTFWHLLTGSHNTREYKARLIQHPLLRIMQRAFAATIFARGETVTRCNNEELILMDYTLRDIAHRPDVALLMVQHWLRICDNPRQGGHVTMGSFVTLIAHKHHLPICTDDPCRGTTLLNISVFESAKFLQIHHGPQQGSERYFWNLDGRESFQLPYLPYFDRSDPSTWLVPNNYVPPAPWVQPYDEDEPQLPPTYAPPHFEHGPHEGTSHAGPSHSQQQSTDDMLRQLLSMSIHHQEEMREVRRLSEDNSARFDSMANRLERIDTRLETMHRVQFEQRFYMDRGYWPSREDYNNFHDYPIYHPPPPQGGDPPANT